jgi:hypothetical protein
VNLGIVGHFIERVSFDYAVVLLTDEGAEIRIESEFLLKTSHGVTVEVNPGAQANLTALLPAILHDVITTATAGDDTGALVLEFSHGARMEVPPDHLYEAWTLATPHGLRVVAPPGGGGLNIFDSEP